MIGLVITAAFALQSSHTPVCVDRLEIQTVLDGNGKEKFTQAITWRWHTRRSPEDWPSGWVVAEWEMVTGEPMAHERGDVWTIRYRSRRTTRNVITRVYKRTFGWSDAEVDNQSVYPHSLRVPYFEDYE